MRSWRKANPFTAISVGAACLYGAWVTGLPPFSGTATVAVLAAGAAAIVWGRQTPGADGPPGQETGAARAAPAGLAAWALLAGALLAWEMAAWFQHPRSEHPTISWMVDQVLEQRPVRSGAFVVWLLVTVWFARR